MIIFRFCCDSCCCPCCGDVVVVGVVVIVVVVVVVVDLYNTVSIIFLFDSAGPIATPTTTITIEETTIASTELPPTSASTTVADDVTTEASGPNKIGKVKGDSSRPAATLVTVIGSVFLFTLLV